MKSIGIHVEGTINNDGTILIGFGMINNIIITYTFFVHNNKCKHMREVNIRGEKTII